jgi:hypothetical protein
MTEPNSQQPADRLEQAVAALRTTPVPDGPSAELVASTTRALQQAGDMPEQGRHSSRRTHMLRICLCSITVAAAVLLPVGVYFALPRTAPPTDRRTEPTEVKAPAEVEVEGTAYRIQGPFSHEDLTVFLLCSNHQAADDFLTLDEGL